MSNELNRGDFFQGQNGYVYHFIDGIARGDVTRFYLDVNGDLFFTGEEPGEVSDGMEITSERHLDAAPLGHLDPIPMADVTDDLVKAFQPHVDSYEDAEWQDDSDFLMH